MRGPWNFILMWAGGLSCGFARHISSGRATPYEIWYGVRAKKQIKAQVASLASDIWFILTTRKG